MAKYRWYKKRQNYFRLARNIQDRLLNRAEVTPQEATWRQEILGEFAPREFSPASREELVTQQLRFTLEAELRERLQSLIGQPNNGDTIREIETGVRNTLNEFRHRGLITDHRIERDNNGNVDITLRPNRGVEHINLTIQLDS